MSEPKPPCGCGVRRKLDLLRLEASEKSMRAARENNIVTSELWAREESILARIIREVDHAPDAARRILGEDE